MRVGKGDVGKRIVCLNKKAAYVHMCVEGWFCEWVWMCIGGCVSGYGCACARVWV